MRWVVIGSSGYIGSALCRYLVEDGKAVLSISRGAAGPQGCSHLQIGEFTAESFAGVFQPGDIVVYAAGMSSARDCRKNPALADTLNSQLPCALLSLADKAGADQFIYLSSVKAVCAPAGEVAGESAGQPATDPYGQSKWRAEQGLLARHCKMRVNILRPAAVYGEFSGYAGVGQPTPRKRAFVWRNRLRRWCKLVPVVPATGYRSFVALEDLLSAIVILAGSSCNREVFIAAEPRYYNLAAISAAASGRSVKSDRLFAGLLLLPFRILSTLGVKVGVLEVARSELYSAERLKSRLNWRPDGRYSQFLRGK
ncbi:NAD-dependent epimerase/dehydratase family protein [Microbulbifer sp. YPW1]|uniref:NAD-dependent epimerase/dehydratase family protein n=1 Tax=Microbulbifer sp. YPW1 TaxID=2745199 RepID=UPI00159758BE|nr:NAD-dependent epimerase/dehydratase family protein [Microbulbifer sp. YPW1]QKX18613.1 NAD-dependent epimerase/dehydratase family protein [Microbulbifer sp. YPW1]